MWAYLRDDDLESFNFTRYRYNKLEFFRVSSRDHMHVMKTHTHMCPIHVHYLYVQVFLCLQVHTKINNNGMCIANSGTTTCTVWSIWLHSRKLPNVHYLIAVLAGFRCPLPLILCSLCLNAECGHCHVWLSTSIVGTTQLLVLHSPNLVYLELFDHSMDLTGPLCCCGHVNCNPWLYMLLIYHSIGQTSVHDYCTEW